MRKFSQTFVKSFRFKDPRSFKVAHNSAYLRNSSLSATRVFLIPTDQCRSFSSEKEIQIVIPPLADSIDSGTLSTWEKDVGDFVRTDDVIAIIDTDKVSVDVKAQEDGELTEKLVEEGDDLKVGDVIGKMVKKDAPAADTSKESKSDRKEEDSTPEKKPSSETPEKQTESAQKSTPKQAEKKEDKPAPKSPKKETQKSTGNAAPLLSFDPSSRTTSSVKMTPIRKKTAERLKESQNTAASLTTFNEVDMSAIFDFRNKYKDAFLKKHDVKLGFMSAFVAAATQALQEQPVVNGRIDADTQSIVYHNYVDVSVAVSAPKGLVTPVLRNTQTMSFADIEKGLMDLAVRARSNKLTLEDLSGGTFTITNGGVFGSLMATPLINMPQSAILGMHGVKERPVVVNGEIVIRPMMYVALSYDHRIIDGRESVTFLKSIKEKLEDPVRFLLEI